MPKWADYCISAVRYDESRTHITYVKAYADNGEKLVDESTYSRLTVVEAIEKGTTFITVLQNSEGKMNKGQKVIVVVINNAKYIKTVDNKREVDNLENLPEF